METRMETDRAAAVVLALGGVALLSSAALTFAQALPAVLGAEGEHMAGDATLWVMLVSLPMTVGGLVALLSARMLWRSSSLGGTVALGENVNHKRPDGDENGHCRADRRARPIWPRRTGFRRRCDGRPTDPGYDVRQPDQDRQRHRDRRKCHGDAENDAQHVAPWLRDLAVPAPATARGGSEGRGRERDGRRDDREPREAPEAPDRAPGPWHVDRRPDRTQ